MDQWDKQTSVVHAVSQQTVIHDVTMETGEDEENSIHSIKDTSLLQKIPLAISSNSQGETGADPLM